MAQMQYTQTAELTGGHSNGITAVAFNPEGSFLATSALNGTVCVWDTKSWSKLAIYYSKTEVTSLAWYTNNALVCSLADGVLSSLVKEGEVLTHVTGFWAHLYPVEHLSVNGTMLAAGAQQEVAVWAWDIQPSRAHIIRSFALPRNIRSDTKAGRGSNSSDDDESGSDDSNSTGRDSPPRTPSAAVRDRHEMELLVTGVFWASSWLIVTYLHHGIHLINSETWQDMKMIPTHTSIVRADISPDGAFLAISNLITGFDVYDLGNGECIRQFKYSSGDNERAVPVLFIHGGHALLGGSTTGTVNIWYVASGDELPPLNIPREQKVLAVAVEILFQSAYYYPHRNRFIIATGTMNAHGTSSTYIWTAEGDDLSGDGDGTGSVYQDEILSSMSLSQVILRTLVYVGSILVVALAMWFALDDNGMEQFAAEPYEIMVSFAGQVYSAVAEYFV